MYLYYNSLFLDLELFEKNCSYFMTHPRTTGTYCFVPESPEQFFCLATQRREMPILGFLIFKREVLKNINKLDIVVSYELHTEKCIDAVLFQHNNILKSNATSKLR